MTEQKGSISTRRKFLSSAGLGLLAFGLGIDQAAAVPWKKKRFKALDENDSFDIGDRADQTLQKAYDLGHEYEERHGGCARCIVAALQDSIEFLPVDDELFRAASCLDGGATPTKNANCGAFTGAGMVLGWICGTERFGNNTLSHKLIHEVHKCFEEEYSSVLCKNVREESNSKCPEVVGKAAQWTTGILLNQFTDYKSQ
ncbi:C-GCAxxG-C-C family protein [Candidatus Neomarinimicrobiota bacterium]